MTNLTPFATSQKFENNMTIIKWKQGTHTKWKKEKKNNKKKKKSNKSWQYIGTSSSSVNVNTNSNEEDGDETKKDNSVDKDGKPTGMHVPKLHHSVSPRELDQQPWTQQHEQHHRYHHWAPIRHWSLTTSDLSLSWVLQTKSLIIRISLPKID